MDWMRLISDSGRAVSRHRLILAFGVAALVMLLSPFRLAVLRAARGGHPHAPDLAVLAGLSLPTKIHITAAFGALLLGLLIFSVRKGHNVHRLMGWSWLGLAMTAALSSFFITSLTPGHWSGLHLFSVWVVLFAPLAALRARRHDVFRHRQAVVALFVGGFVINLLFAFLPGRALWRTFFG